MSAKHFFMLICWFVPSFVSAQTAYEVWFQSGGLRHHGLLMAGAREGEWVFRVKYPDAACRCERLIEQTMQMEKTSVGFRLTARSVWDVYRRRTPEDYAADSFFLYRDARGNWYSRNIDTQGSSSAMDFRAVLPQEEYAKRKDFGI